MKKEANEVMYKMAEVLLKKMQESGLISKEEGEKITVLINMDAAGPARSSIRTAATAPFPRRPARKFRDIFR